MIDRQFRESVTTALDPHLLATPFEVQTNWHVITGAPCCGKSTLIDQLAAEGYQTIPEVGRAYIEREIARGRTLEAIRADPPAFDWVLRDLQLNTEGGLRPDDVLFLDRGYPDSLSFFRLHGLDPNAILPECFNHRYASVFILDRFPTKQDCARIEDEALAEFLDEWHPRDYTSLGYAVVRVPVLPPEERASFVLGWLSGQGLI